LIVELQGPDVRFPWATFFINVSGSLILGWVAATFLDDRNPNLRKWHLLLGTGFCGGFTTFSTFSYETMLLFLQGKRSLAILYSFGSVALGLLGVWLGVKIAGKP
jgi:CrcB protein